MLLRPARLFLTVVLTMAVAAAAFGEDWPMWRFDAARSAASPEKLPDNLHLLWSVEYGPREQVWDDPLNNDLMPYDKIFEPVVAAGRMFVGFNDRDKLVALDAGSGRQLWEFFADGPVRLPPVAWQGKVYFASDDGYLYCLNAASGQLRWRFRGGPSARKVLGNRRVISAWPARGGPVLRDGTIYFAASIWPFMGTFIYALDAESGKVVWSNDRTGADYVWQPHHALSFGGVAPQGALAATDRFLLVPGGRSMPAALDRHTGEVVHFQLDAGGKGNGGSLVIAGRDEFYVHTRQRGVRAFDLKTGKKTNFVLNEPVVTNDFLYTSAENAAGPVVAAIDARKKIRWEVEVDGSGDLVMAGDRLYAAGKDAITAIQIPEGDQAPAENLSENSQKSQEKPSVAWSIPVEGEVLRLLAADGKLFAVTLDGRILAFGDQPPAAAGSDRIHAVQEHQMPPKPDESGHYERSVAEAKAILRQAGTDEGYALVFGVDDGAFLEALALQSQLHLVAVDADASKVDRLRLQFDAATPLWKDGRRVAIHEGDPASYQAPPYIANLIVVGKSRAAQIKDERTLFAIYESVRPYGGVLWIAAPGGQASRLAGLAAAARLKGAKIAPGDDHLAVVRQGPLEGAGQWTHQYGNVANTVKSDDARVKLPLGLLWFGGNSNLDVLPRHGHGPPEQVVGGRLFIEGMDCLSARDVYTGRVLWKQTFEKLGSFGVYFDDSYTDTPLSIAYNQKHIPGANARGTNFVAAADKVYLVSGSGCRVLEAATGETLKEISLPRQADQHDRPAWGYIGVYDDLLLAGAGLGAPKAEEGDRGQGTGHREKGGPTTLAVNPQLSPLDFSASRELVVFERHSGNVLWKADARFSFLHNGIVAGGGRIYCLDRIPPGAEEKLVRRGQKKEGEKRRSGEGESKKAEGGMRKAESRTPNPSTLNPQPSTLNPRIVAFDAHSGRIVWETEEDVFGTWLGYSDEHDVLLEAGAKASDRLPDEAGRGLAAYRGRDGRVEWKNLDVSYSGPCILHHEWIITNADQHSDEKTPPSRAFNLLDGHPRMVDNPITGAAEPWQMARGKGCSTIVASEHLLLLRDGAAGYLDLANPDGIGHFGGFKTGCTSNLIAADGVLNAPDYTRTCSCPYQNQTSLALVPMPDVELWTVTHFADDRAGRRRIERVGINLGAPGDRRSGDGTLWVEYPTRPDTPPLGFTVTVAGRDVDYFCHHEWEVEGPALRWVAASGARNVESVTVQLDADDGQDTAEPRPAASTTAYTVRLYFAEPDGLVPGRRVFDVSLQGKKVLDRFDVAGAARAARTDRIHAAAGESAATAPSLVREFPAVPVADVLRIELAPDQGADAAPVLSGVEIIAE